MSNDALRQDLERIRQVSALQQEALWRLSAQQQNQRFYLMRFMWVVTSALEQLNCPKPKVNELRGLYQGFSEGIDFTELIGKKEGQPETD